jgi:hypothetical protein
MPNRNPKETKPWEPRLEKEPIFNPFATPVDPSLEPEESPEVTEETEIERNELSLDAGETARERIDPSVPRAPITPAEK